MISNLFVQLLIAITCVLVGCKSISPQCGQVKNVTSVKAYIKDDVLLELLDAKHDLFRLVNNSNRPLPILMYTDFGEDNKIIYSYPLDVTYEVFRTGAWCNLPLTNDVLGGIYELRPNEVMISQIPFTYFEALGVSIGALVRISVGDIHSKSFILRNYNSDDSSPLMRTIFQYPQVKHQR